MELWVGRSGNSLKPAKDQDLKKLKKFKEGEMILVRVDRPRNPKLHRKYFALIKVTFENQEYFQDIEHLRKFLEMAAGYYEIAYLPNRKTGEIVTQYWPKSIAWDKLGQDEFQELFEGVLQQIYLNFNFDPESLENEVKYE